MTVRIFFTATLGIILTMSAEAQNSPHGNIKIPCASCHSTDSWKMRADATFDHAQTGFVLDGQHKTVACASCHKDLRFSATTNRCSSCHTDVHKSELGPNCIRCHSTKSWKISDMIQKHQSTRFPLFGKHATLECQDCHSGVANSQYVGTPVSCIGCHRADFVSATNPNHAGAGFSTNCVQCHITTAMTWTVSFDHSTTQFPLVGAHKSVACNSCHQSADFRSTPTNCYPCHQTQFASTVDPNHVAGGFPTDCRTCHTTTVWHPSTFTHDNTKFPLTGGHRAVACKDCHTNNQYSTLSTNCIDCHRSDFSGTTNPNHATGGFPQNCMMCHTTTVWKPASFDHSTTKFVLTGVHATLQCQSCHVNDNYHVVYSSCYQCHSSDFTAATNPNHTSGNFSQNCQTCHSTIGWKPATFDHGTTKFALTGAHATTPCQSCHANGNYQLVYANCYQCHSADYASAANPNHVAGKFSQTCQTCHTTSAWQPASFDHSSTKFALTGVHTTTPCQSCHTNNNYQLTYTGCYSCHSANFTATTNPNHTSAGFPTTCETCHTTTSWAGATFSHTWFPTSHGNAAGKCATCHTNPANYAVFTCITCHTQAQTDPHHSGVRGYVYNNANCYSCHPNGRGG